MSTMTRRKREARSSCGREIIEETLCLSNVAKEFCDFRRHFTRMNDIDESEKVTVNKVCQDFREREDGALAHKLQDEEFQKHYGMNKNERKSVRTDVRVAKQTYLEEIRTARLLPEDELSQMEETDKWLARDLQEKLHNEERREINKQHEIELHDAKVAKDLQLREKEKYDRQWRRQKQREEEERRHLQRTMGELSQSEQDSRRRPPNPVREPIAMNGHTDDVPRRTRRTNSREGNREDKRRSTGSGSSGGSVGKEDRQPKTSTRYGNEAVVALPTPENSGGGRLESDRIIMADGTAIDLFENEEDREKALKLQSVRKDETYAKMLQDQERRIVEAEKMASENRRVAMEEQDRELARHLQRKEYHRLKKEQKDRQMQRANSVPSDRHSVSIEDPRRLPSYEEAVHRNQMPDLLPDHNFNSENLQERNPKTSTYSTTQSSRSASSHSPSLERCSSNPENKRKEYTTREHGRITSRGPSSDDHRKSTPMVMEDRHPSHTEYGRSGERDHYRQNRPPSPTGHGHPSRDYRMDSNENRKPLGCDNIEKERHKFQDKEAPVWQTRDLVCSSNSSSRERYEYPENNHGSSRSSYASSGQSSCDRRSQTSGQAGSPPSRGDVWERFDDEETPFDESRNNRPSRSRTVASSPPAHYERERPLSYNVVENIDPTFKRERKSSEDDPKDQNPDEKAKAVPLIIKPHRRKSTERKRDRAADRMDKENCKQQ